MYNADDERKVIISIPVNPCTSRWIYTCYQINSEMLIMHQSQISDATIRQCCYVSSLQTSEIKCSFEVYAGSQTTNRYCYIEKPEFPAGVVQCTYIPGAQIIFLTIPTCSLQQYISDKICFVEQTQISQRQIVLSYIATSDRYISVLLNNKRFVHSFPATSSISINSERSVMFVTGDFCQLINIVPHIGYSNRFISIAVMQQKVLFTPIVQSSVTNYNSELICICHSLSSHTERYCLLSLSPYTERFVCFRFKTYSERYCTSIFMTSKYYHCNPIIQAVPNASEIICYLKSFGYRTERKCFVEVLELSTSIQPITVSNPIIIRSLKEGFANILLITKRNLDFYVKDSLKQIVSEINFSEYIIRSEDDVIEISGVDKNGAKISLDRSISKPLYHSASFDLNVTLSGWLYQEIGWQVAPSSSSSYSSSSSTSYSSTSNSNFIDSTPPDGIHITQLFAQVEVEVSGDIDDDAGPDGVHVTQMITQVEISED